jgi:phenylacetate-CoA ligase
MASIYDWLYGRSPLWLQNFGLNVYGLIWKQRRFGGCFRAALAAFKARESFSALAWQSYQEEALRKLLCHAAANVPYYRRALGDGFAQRASGFRLAQLGELPLLEKERLRAEPLAFIAETANPRRLHRYLTSGTTGTPLTILFSTDMHRRWSAVYEARVRNWAGVNYQMSRAMLGGRLVAPKAAAKPPFWRYNRAERQLYLSAFHLAPPHAPCYAAALRHYAPDYLVGYASGLYFLARMIVEQRLAPGRPRAVLTSSEKLEPEMRQVIEAAYQAPVYDAYSGVEACCLASECQHHRLHISPDVGIIELLDDAGQPVQPGEAGEIVATGLLNFDQPLIRYRTGDMAVLSQEPCPCGRQMAVLQELVGRLEDTVIGADGREMVRFHGIFVGLPHIRQGQVIQETTTQFRLRLVTTPEFNDHDRETIAARFLQRLGAVDLVYEFVDSIECTERGKFRAVISKVQRNRPSAPPS